MAEKQTLSKSDVGVLNVSDVSKSVVVCPHCGMDFREQSAGWLSDFKRRRVCPLCAAHRDNGTGDYITCGEQSCRLCKGAEKHAVLTLKK